MILFSCSNSVILSTELISIFSHIYFQTAKLPCLCISPFHFLFADHYLEENQGQWNTWNESDIKAFDYQHRNSFS